MQKTHSEQAMHAHRKTGTSTTLNRRYVKRPQHGTEALEVSVQEAAHAESQAKQIEHAKAAQRAQAAPKIKPLAFGQIQPLGQVQELHTQTQQTQQVQQAAAQQINVTQSGQIQHFRRSAPKSGRAIKVQDDDDTVAKSKLEQEINAEQYQQALAEQAEQRRAEQAEAKAHAQVHAQLQTQAQMQQQAQQGQAMVPSAVAPMHPLQAHALDRMQTRRQAAQSRQVAPKMSARQVKDQAIKKALATSSQVIDKDIAQRERAEKRAKLHFSIARIMLAISCAAAAVVAIVYFVNTNMPDISMRVAAIQTGIEASYPSYVPRDYSLSNLSSQDGRVTMNFVNNDNGDSFSLIEENSSWDSNALLNNYVKPELGEDYTIVREQGLTIYATNQDAAWVNSGVVYKIKVHSGELTKKQIKSIAVSL